MLELKTASSQQRELQDKMPRTEADATTEAPHVKPRKNKNKLNISKRRIL